ncbi:MAG: hypothetical protein JNL49_04090 [Bacteroidia bacterium]|nr:hypothetical protein [Bacteroidia bacterium]
MSIDSILSIYQIAIDTLHSNDVSFPDSIYLNIDNKGTNNYYPEIFNLLSAFLGGTLVLLGHFILEHFSRKNKKQLELLNTLGVIVTTNGNLKNNFRELAMFKTHAAYWEYFSKIADNSKDKEERYIYHLKSQHEYRTIEREIGVLIATFRAHIIRIEILLNDKILTDEIKNNIESISFKKAITYSIEMPYDEVRNNKVETDESNLRQDYYSKLNDFDKVIDLIQNKIVRKGNFL